MGGGGLKGGEKKLEYTNQCVTTMHNRGNTAVAGDYILYINPAMHLKIHTTLNQHGTKLSILKWFSL
jgi:hypothetical protein